MIRVTCTDISEMGEMLYQALYEKASDQRRSKADRYRNRLDAVRCLTAGALLRYALGMETFTEEKASNGKPFIKEKKDFYYNLSHSGRWVVLAFGDSEVGVDVEQIRKDTDIASVAARFFSIEEQQYVWEKSSQSRSRFFEVWTGKESYLKYLGTGLRKDLTSFSILSLPPEVQLHYKTLPDGCSLCLCTTETEYTFEMLDIQQLCRKE